MFKQLLLACVCVLPVAKGDRWAVLVAGSKGYWNYRHQSDVYHTYQLLTEKGGFPDDRVILLHYDDIAFHANNPFPGELVNHPTGPNVYANIPQDYTKDDVNAANFLAILRGDKDAMQGIGSGRVVESTSEDHVFVFYSDHGASGLLAFPNSYLYASDLVSTIHDMYDGNQYSRMVFYIEACESGSMFDGLLSADVDVFATTASSPYESSYATYYDNTRATYLGDEYSVNWMEQSDVADLDRTDLMQQFDHVVNLTQMSTPHMYGDKSISSLPLSEFQSYSRSQAHFSNPDVHVRELMDSRDVKLEWLRRVTRDPPVHISPQDVDKLKYQLEQEIVGRFIAEQVFSDILELVHAPKISSLQEVVDSRVLPRDFECLKRCVESYENICDKFSDFSLKFVKVFTVLCESGVTVAEIVSAVEVACEGE